MAKSIKDNVVTMAKPRGRPKKVTAMTSTAAATAPGFGHNAPDASVFLRHVTALRRQDEAIAAKKLELKTENRKRKDLRKEAQADGLVMRQLDEALEALDSQLEPAELIAREQRRRLYFEWLNLPLGTQGELDLEQKATDTEREMTRWYKRGDTDGRLDRPRANPDGCPPECLPEYLRGHDAGTMMRMANTPITAGAFDKDGKLKTQADFKEQVAQAAAEVAEGAKMPPEVLEEKFEVIVETGIEMTMLTLDESAFQSEIKGDLDLANLKTLHPSQVDAFNAADIVVAVFGRARRILKEENYVDTGEDDVDLTPIEVEGETEVVPVAEVAPEAADLA